jgi:branched-chain amino acid transport system ATP-binding protein
MLRIENLSARFGQAEVLRSVSLRVGAGEVVTLCGRNGAGKTTLLRCVMGLHAEQRGAVAFGDHRLDGLPPEKRAALGVGWVPDDCGVYATLSVAENLRLPAPVSRHGWRIERLYDAFPALYDRRNSRASTLSGGEQRMLAFARVLRMGASLLLCDEPTAGLAPLFVSRIGDIIRDVRDHGTTVLLVEQNLRFAATVADRHYLLSEGRIVDALDNTEVRARVHELLVHLGL